MDLEKRISELEIDVQVADARANAALQIAFKLFEMAQDKRWVRGDIENFAPHVFSQVNENDDPAYELALLDVWRSGLVPTGLPMGEEYELDMRTRMRLREKIADRIHRDHHRAE